MKKLMIAAAIVCAAAVSQAAMIKWSANVVGVDPASVGDNGVYAASGSALGGLSYTLMVYTEAGGTAIGAGKSGTLSTATSQITYSNTGLKQGSTYYYEVVLNGTQSSLTSKTSAEYDYSGAKLNGTFSGTVTIPSVGAGTFAGGPSSWTVSGIVAAPEPTSGLLLLLGMAGLALKRKQK